ncbi:MAG: helix-turn-helix transcriptional regulator, partial [Acidobacteriota bacterium]
MKSAIATLRRHRGESQGEFASRLGISHQVIRKYESERGNDPSDLRILAKFGLLSIESDRADLADMFASAIQEIAPEIQRLELALSHERTQSASVGAVGEPKTAKEKRLVALLLKCMRDKDGFGQNV